jgi:alpha-L-rhamnosidase
MTVFMRLDLDDGSTMRVTGDRAWRTSLAHDLTWFLTGYDDKSWESAYPMTTVHAQPWPPTPAMYLRRTFTLERSPQSARLYATALGAYESSLNGRRVGDALLTPESAQSKDRVLYQVYDVTAMLHEGLNCLGMTVGDGWYASTLFGAGRYAWGLPPRRVLAQLELTFADGSRELVATGPG